MNAKAPRQLLAVVQSYSWSGYFSRCRFFFCGFLSASSNARSICEAHHHRSINVYAARIYSLSRNQHQFTPESISLVDLL